MMMFIYYVIDLNFTFLTRLSFQFEQVFHVAFGVPTFYNNPKAICTNLWSPQYHEACMFYHQSVHCLDGLNNYSCAFKCGTSWGWLARRLILPCKQLEYSLLGVLEGVTHSKTCSEISIYPNISQVSLQVLTSKYQPWRYSCLFHTLGTSWTRLSFR